MGKSHSPGRRGLRHPQGLCPPDTRPEAAGGDGDICPQALRLGGPWEVSKETMDSEERDLPGEALTLERRE